MGSDGRPLLVNTWLALTSVDERNSTMFAVPRSRDPHYPSELVRKPAEDLGIALPAEAGTFLYWDANVFHWGGKMRADAPGPRISSSYTIVARDHYPEWSRLDAHTLDFSKRLDCISSWIDTYGHYVPDLTPEVALWARVRNKMIALSSK